MKQVRVWAGGVAVFFLVFGGFAGKSAVLRPDQVIYPLILEQAGGPVSLGESFVKKNDARAAGQALEAATQGLAVTVSPASLIGEDNGSGLVYPLFVQHESGENYVAKAYTDPQAAGEGALNLGFGGNTWVVIGASRVRDKHEGLIARLIPSPILLLAETLLDPVTTTVVTLPTEVRTGAFTSPEVRFTTQVETAKVSIFLPVDADWLDSGNGLEIWLERSPDSGGSWVSMCASPFYQYGGGRPNLKDGTPNPGGSLSCSNRDPQNVLYPASTWYRIQFVVTGSMTMGGEVRFSSQGQ